MTTKQLASNELSGQLSQLFDNTGDVNYTLKKVEELLTLVIDQEVKEEGLFLNMVLDYTKQAKVELKELESSIKGVWNTIDNYQ